MVIDFAKLSLKGIGHKRFKKNTTEDIKHSYKTIL